MRNYRDLTPHEVERLKDEYPITANRHLAIRYDVSIDGIRTLAKKQGWKKDHNALLAGKRELHTLTAEEEAWIIKHFRNTPNAAIMQRIDIGESTLHRIARKHGLKKTSQYMNRARRLNAEVGTQTRSREEWPGYKPGLKPWEQPGMTRRKYVRAKQKAEEAMKHQRKMECFRIVSGEKQQTKLRLCTNITHRASVQKHRMIKEYDYFAIEGEVGVICYDEQTRRSIRSEETARRHGLKVEAADE